MSPRTCTRNRLTTTVVFLGLLLGTASRVDAQECYECDDLSESCDSVCEGNGGSPVSGYYGSDEGKES